MCIPGRYLLVACSPYPTLDPTWVSDRIRQAPLRYSTEVFQALGVVFSSSAQKSDIERFLLGGAQFPATECRVALRISRLAAAESADPHQSAFLYVLYDIIQTKDT